MMIPPHPLHFRSPIRYKPVTQETCFSLTNKQKNVTAPFNSTFSLSPQCPHTVVKTRKQLRQRNVGGRNSLKPTSRNKIQIKKEIAQEQLNSPIFFLLMIIQIVTRQSMSRGHKLKIRTRAEDHWKQKQKQKLSLPKTSYAPWTLDFHMHILGPLPPPSMTPQCTTPLHTSISLNSPPITSAQLPCLSSLAPLDLHTASSLPLPLTTFLGCYFDG